MHMQENAFAPYLPPSSNHSSFFVCHKSLTIMGNAEVCPKRRRAYASLRPCIAHAQSFFYRRRICVMKMTRRRIQACR